MKSLSAFLSLALATQQESRPRHGENPRASTTPTWFFASSFHSQSAFDAYDDLIWPHLSGLSASTYRVSRQWKKTWDVQNSSENFVDSSSWAIGNLCTEVTLADLANLEQTLAEAGSSAEDAATLAYLMVSCQPSLRWSCSTLGSS